MTTNLLYPFRALLLGGSLLAAGTALAGEVPVVGKLEVKAPAVSAKSWSGKDSERTKAQHHIDPMVFKVSNVHPGTKLQIFRQGRSNDVELAEKISGPEALETAARAASVWKPVHEMKTANAHIGEVTSVVHSDPAKVLWPNTRLKITGETRDKQALPHVTAVVEGLNTTREQRYSPVTEQTHSVYLSGEYLPSARAWIHANNLFVSEPVQNEAQLKEGQHKLTLAAEKEKLAKDTKFALEEEENSSNPDYDKKKELRRKISDLDAEAATLKEEAAPLIEQGRKVLVNVVSAAAAPAHAKMFTFNPRVAGENGNAQHTATNDTNADGFVMQSVEALREDTLKTTVHFEAARGTSVGSLHEVTYEVPHADTKAAFEMNGVRYYRVKPLSSRQVNDTPAE